MLNPHFGHAGTCESFGGVVVSGGLKGKISVTPGQLSRLHCNLAGLSNLSSSELLCVQTFPRVKIVFDSSVGLPVHAGVDIGVYTTCIFRM